MSTNLRPMKQMIIHLISTPRTISTTLMYSFNQREDTIGIDEPYYAYWLDKTGITHPGRDTVLSEYPTDPDRILSMIHDLNHSIIFIKNMSKHMDGLPLDTIKSWTHVFLIRNPSYIIYSMEQVLDQLHQSDVGTYEQYVYYQELIQRGSKCIVIKSEDILQNPELKLRQLCDELSISFNEDMLSWPAGSKSIDGNWAKYWYANVHKSTGWIQRSPRPIPHVHHTSLLKKNLPYFNLLEQKAI